MTCPDDTSTILDGMRALAPTNQVDNQLLAAQVNGVEAVAAAKAAYNTTLDAIDARAAGERLYLQVAVTPDEQATPIEVAGLLRGCQGDTDSPEKPLLVVLNQWGHRREHFLLPPNPRQIQVWRVRQIFPEPIIGSQLRDIAKLLQDAETARQELLSARHKLKSLLQNLAGKPVHLVNVEAHAPNGRSLGGPLVESYWGWVEAVELAPGEQQITRVTMTERSPSKGPRFYFKSQRGSRIIPVISITPIAGI